MYDKRGLPGELFGWCLPKTGAALDDPARRARLMQVWDFSAGTIAGVGRAQVNPNHVTFEIGGEPVLTDGIPAPDTDPWHYPVDKVFERLDSVARARYAKYMGGINAGHTAELENIARGLAPGLIGGANAIVLDDQPWYWPGETRTGKAVFYAKAPEMQVVTSDATAFYRPTYDVTRMRRTSLWTDAGFGIILDDCEAESPHSWTWKAYLRPDAVLDGSTAHVRLPNGKSVLIVWTPACDCRLVDVAGFPRTEEGRSKRLELTKRGTHAAFSVMIAPVARAGRVKQVSKHLIEVRVDDRIHLLLLDQHSGESTRMYGRQTTAPYAWHKPEGRLVEIHDGLTPEATPDVHDLPDIAADRDLQLPEFEALCKWTAERTVPAASRLSQLDACLAEIPQAVPGTAGLEAALRSPHWPVQCAAAEVVGRARMRAFAPMLRELLAAEHAIPEAELYPPVNSTPQPEDAPPPPPGADAEAPAKRWRLRTALIVALGRLGDRESVPLLHAILADGHDFYPVYSVAAQALGRIGGDDARAALATALAESEVNTHTRAQFALQALGGQS